MSFVQMKKKKKKQAGGRLVPPPAAPTLGLPFCFLSAPPVAFLFALFPSLSINNSTETRLIFCFASLEKPDEQKELSSSSFDPRPRSRSNVASSTV